MADIEIVQPVPGATRVTFDYGAASEAIDAYSRMARVLNAQATARVGPHDAAIVNWNGYFRGQFDEAFNMLQARFTAGVEGAGYGPVQIYEAVAEANDMQRTFNQNAERPIERPNEPAGPGGAY
jgi:hypothetical protein